MKKHLLGMLMAGAAVLSACEANVHPELTENESDAVVFTASLGQGTKTYLDYDADAGVYKTKWANGDGILLLALQADQTYSSTNLTLASGAGTTEGVFNSAISGNEYISYYGRYGDNSDLAAGVISPVFPPYQYDRKLIVTDGTTSFLDNSFPMYAEGDSHHLEFKNLGAVLKMSLLGTDYIDNIVVKANVPISGFATIVRGSDDAPLHTVMIDSLSMNSVTYYLKDQLSETQAKDCYIVIPAQTYTGGLTVTINSYLGSMTKTFSSDLVFQRSQLRAIPTFTYVNEKYHSMSLISSASMWTEDCELEMKDNVYVGRLTLSEDEEFKFRANGSWDYNLGSPDAVVSGTAVKLYPDGPNMKVAVAGTYDIVLNLAENTAVFTLVEEEIPVVSTYDELATYEDSTIVRAQGYVLAVNSRGFIFNLNGTIDNSVFVYQGADQSMYAPKIGNIVELVAEKGTYGEHAELTNIKSVEIIDASEQDWTATHLVDLSKNPTAFDEFAYDRPVFVRMRGTLEKNGEEWNVVVGGATRKGSIEFPAWDLSGYIGQPIIVDGWYIGGTASTLSVVERYISYGGVDGGGTEDVVPGDDLNPDTTIQASVTAEASEIQCNSVTISGCLAIQSEGSFSKSAILYYSSSKNTLEGLKSNGKRKTLTLEEDGSFSAVLTSLSSSSSYNFVVVAKVDDVELITGVKAFKTLTIQASVTAEVAEIICIPATISGCLAIQSEGSFSKSAKVYYSSSESTLEGLKSNGTSKTLTLEKDGSYSAVLTLLSSSSSYNFVVVAKVDDVEFVSSIGNFLTPALPSVPLVDLGLSVKWASCNLGASSLTEYGGLYQWAGTTDVSDTSIYLDWDNCPYHTGSDERTGWTKYNTESSYGTVDNKKVLEAMDDAASVALGGKWRIPTEEEWAELRKTDNCSWTWMTIDGVNGYKVQSKRSGYTENWIFLPAAGCSSYGQKRDVGLGGYYWSSSLTNYPHRAYDRDFNLSYVGRDGHGRYYGKSVRPVSE